MCERARKIALSHLLDDVSEGATDPFHCAEVEEYFESLTADGLCGACFKVSGAKRQKAATAFWNLFGTSFRVSLVSSHQICAR
jgi:hypothetical protein